MVLKISNVIFTSLNSGNKFKCGRISAEHFTVQLFPAKQRHNKTLRGVVRTVSIGISDCIIFYAVKRTIKLFISVFVIKNVDP